MALGIQHAWHRCSAAVLKATSNTASMSMTTGNAINAGPATTDCMAWQ